jgi:hypothetical protein
MNNLISLEQENILVLGIERTVYTSVQYEWPRKKFYEHVVRFVDNMQRDLDPQKRGRAKPSGETTRGTELCAF